MTIYNQWDIVLVPFPFTNLKKTKKRPALIISPEHYNIGQDVIIAFMTSNIKSFPQFGDYHIIEWELSGLPKPTLIRMKLATILKEILIKKLGNLQNEDISGFQKELKSFFK
jgi:mRNA interferase MazF